MVAFAHLVDWTLANIYLLQNIHVHSFRLLEFLASSLFRPNLILIVEVWMNNRSNWESQADPLQLFRRSVKVNHHNEGTRFTESPIQAPNDSDEIPERT